MRVKPGQLVRLRPDYYSWWGLNLERTKKVWSDMRASIVIHTYNMGQPRAMYSVLLLTRDGQLIWMCEDLLELR